MIGLGKGRAIDTPKESQQMILTGAESSNIKKGGRTMPEKLKTCPFCGSEWKDFTELIEEVRND